MSKPLSYCSLLIFLVISAHFVKAQTTDLISEHFKLLNSHDIKGLTGEYAIDALIYSPNWEGAKIGPAGITEVYSRYYKTTPDLAYKVTNNKPVFLFYRAAILLVMGKNKEAIIQLEQAMHVAPKTLRKFIDLVPESLQNQQIVDVLARFKRNKSI